MKSVIGQAPGAFIEAKDLAPAIRGYNASLAAFNGRHLMAYRQEPHGGGLSRLKMAEMIGGRVIDDRPIVVPESPTGDSLEDPRLFVHRGRLWIAWTSALYRGAGWTCRQLYGLLDETEEGWKVEIAHAPAYGKNNGTAKEKNWQFFSVRDELFAQYKPHHVLRIEGDKILGEWKTPPLGWKWGEASGGTPPLPYAPGQLITFFHAYEFDPKHSRRYNFAALVFEDKPPFRRVAISIGPMITASEADPLPEEKEWQPLCIFPCGAIRDGEEWIISAGVNDERIALLRFSEPALLLDSFRVSKLPATIEVEVVEPIFDRGQMVCPPATRKLPRSVALDLLARKKITLIPQPA